MSVREIAAELGVHRTTVREWMREHDVPPVQRP
jgi:excisionase family DNA binding protein